MLITRHHLESIEKAVGYNCVAGVTVGNYTHDGCTIVQVLAPNPKTGKMYTAHRAFEFEPVRGVFDRQITYFAMEAKTMFDEEFKE